jgi:putative addiction module killer protein
METAETTPHLHSPPPLPSPQGRGERGRGERVRGYFQSTVWNALESSWRRCYTECDLKVTRQAPIRSMEAKPRCIRHYVAADGACPFREWMADVRKQRIHAKISQRLDRAEQGNFGKWKSVGEGVCELIIDFGPGYRVYFGQDGDLVVLLCVGDKTSQEEDIKKAKHYWEDYNA